jgi:hypothetical protein
VRISALWDLNIELAYFYDVRTTGAGLLSYLRRKRSYFSASGIAPDNETSSRLRSFCLAGEAGGSTEYSMQRSMIHAHYDFFCSVYGHLLHVLHDFSSFLDQCGIGGWNYGDTSDEPIHHKGWR